MAGFVRGMALAGFVAGVVAVAYSVFLDDETKEKVCSVVEEGAAWTKDALEKAGSALQDTPIEDLQELAQNRAWIDKQWKDIGY